MADDVLLQVVNGPVYVGAIRVLGIASSAALLVGDTDSLTLYSYFDTPAESVIVGPLAPFPPLPGEDVE
ncbi:spore gernimation protein GerPD [Cohnella candidum]|uniref:Spore gernimation protein GerPD n=1 Tax=Cohnella candidum TaxID=2674991 RepID=A0A3G3JYE7_9BACL|nr:spore gernimation protein GerPD [Cohnella candidum]AYQ72861.1 spore gernimation protein GerPD [Cohnella candidum]